MHKKLMLFLLFVISIFTIPHSSFASGPFGPPEPVVRGSGGLHTAFGYWRAEDRYENGSDYTFVQNRVYSEAGYGSRNWEIYGRLGLADLEIKDAYQAGSSSVTSSRRDYQDNWSVFGTLGGKLFYIADSTFGVGGFFQATRSGDYNDSVSGTANGTPYTTDVKVETPWDATVGIAVQAKVPYGIRLYAGPFLSYSEAKVSSSATIGGLNITASDLTLRNKSLFGGYAGVDMPLYRLFRLNVEGQYSERFSAGAAISLVY